MDFSLFFLTEKNVFFEPRSSADYEKRRVFSLWERSPRTFLLLLLIKSVILTLIDFPREGRRSDKSGCSKVRCCDCNTAVLLLNWSWTHKYVEVSVKTWDLAVCDITWEK